MDEKKVNKFRIQLLKQRDQFLKTLGKKEKELQENIYESTGDGRYTYHIADMASDEELVDSISLIATNIHEKIKAIDEALKRIEDGTFGICVHCDKEIPFLRLKAVPYVKYCIKCQEDIEAHGQFKH